MNTLHTATSHFYRDSYFCRFCLVYKLRLLLVTFCLWFVEVATQSSTCEATENVHLSSDDLSVSQLPQLPDLDPVLRRSRVGCVIRPPVILDS